MDSNYRAVAVQAARAGAEELMRFRKDFSVREKAPRDLVTDADLASQRAIFDSLRSAYPETALVGEEEGCNQPPRDADGRIRNDVPIWIVDPLDGTVNYVHRLHSFCVSIALLHQGELQVGVVLDPLSDELFVAVRGQGATVSRTDGLSEEALRASSCEDLSDALLACSFPAGVRKDAAEVRQFCEVLPSCRSLRRLGSCALNLCYVAAGRLDGYWAQSVQSWDMAAGALMVAEAGGQVTNLQGGPLDVWNPRFVASGTPTVGRALVAAIA